MLSEVDMIQISFPFGNSIIYYWCIFFNTCVRIQNIDYFKCSNSEFARYCFAFMWVDSNTTSGSIPAFFACAYRSAQMHHLSPFFKPGKLPCAVDRSFPFDFVYCRNSSDILAHTKCFPTSSVVWWQYPSRSHPVIGFTLQTWRGWPQTFLPFCMREEKMYPSFNDESQRHCRRKKVVIDLQPRLLRHIQKHSQAFGRIEVNILRDLSCRLQALVHFWVRLAFCPF